MTEPAPHPAVFSGPILAEMKLLVRQYGVTRILDPFAGTGKVHELANDEVSTIGIEIEPEWAAWHPRTMVGDALNPPAGLGTFDCILTSPTYGNRMADHHNAKDPSKRITYKHKLGRDPSENNSGVLHYGPKYCSFHIRAWTSVLNLLDPGGYFFLNVKNFYRTVRGERTLVDVARFHREALIPLGIKWISRIEVPVNGMGFGANRDVRVDHEVILVGRKV